MMFHAFTRTAVRCFLPTVALVSVACKGDSITDRDPDSVFGNATVSVVSFGVDVDPDGYVLDVRGIEQHDLPTSGEVDLRVVVGPASLTLRGIASNCHVVGDSVRTVDIQPESSVEETFILTCGGGNEHLAFASFRSGNGDIYIRKEGSTTDIQLTSSPWRDTDPVWSPDGNRLAYATLSTDSGTSAFETSLIRIVSADGDSLATIGAMGKRTYYPAWAPSQDRIAYASNESGNFELYIANLDGTGAVKLTNTPDDELRPAWSPDGTRLVYDVGVADTTIKRDLFIINADGTGARQLATGGRYNFHASWSPDGQQIAFVSQRDGNEEVYLTKVDGSAILRLTFNGTTDGSPVWSADGKWVIFESDRSGPRAVFRRPLPEGPVEMLTTPGFEDFDPAVSR